MPFDQLVKAPPLPQFLMDPYKARLRLQVLEKGFKALEERVQIACLQKEAGTNNKHFKVSCTQKRENLHGTEDQQKNTKLQGVNFSMT